jgi:hypothetical protein
MKIISVTIFGIFLLIHNLGGQNITSNRLINSYEYNNGRYDIDECFLEASSNEHNDRFFMELNCCNVTNPNSMDEQSKIKRQIYFNLKSDKSKKKGETIIGKYKFSSEKSDTEGLMTFEGALLHDNREYIKISDGIIKIKKDKKKIVISMDLTLENKLELKGNYSGNYSVRITY